MNIILILKDLFFFFWDFQAVLRELNQFGVYLTVLGEGQDIEVGNNDS